MGNELLNRYVLGFAFTPNMMNVALIRKERVRPGFEWMKGKMNGLGGKIREGETSLDAMVREFQEESGVEIQADKWEYCGTFYRRGEYEVHVFRAVDEGVYDVQTASPEEGTVYRVGISNLRDYPTTPAVAWLVPMLMYPGLRVFKVAEK